MPRAPWGGAPAARWLAFGCLGAAATWGADLRADEPRLPAEPRTMREAGEHVSVVDAFDDDDPFDLHVGLDFELTSRSADVYRRSPLGGTRKVATYGHELTRLVPRLDIGLHRDLALVVRVPLVLSDSRQLRAADGGAGLVLGGAGEALLRFPFRAAERSGLESVVVGLDAALLSATRGRGPIELLLGAELRIAASAAMRACRQDPPAGQVECAHPADVDRDGRAGPEEPDARGPVDAGLSRGTLGIEIHSAAARRFGGVEPYLTGSALFEVPTSAIWDAPTVGTGPAAPPVRVDAALGVALIPWENRERFSRLTFDAHALAELRTRGRDFSELFDAVGTSYAPSLREPVTREGARAYTTGLDVVDAHGRLGLGSNLSWQPSQLVKIGAGLRLSWDTSHGITAERACTSADCPPGAVTNPAYRDVLHADDARFSVESATTVAFRARGVVMF